MNQPAEHTFSVDHTPYFSGPYTWRAWCSCGLWSGGGKGGYEVGRGLESDWRQHRDAKAEQA